MTITADPHGATGANRVSVIVPVLNEELSLSQVSGHLQSLARQCHELIIADGGSSDNTLQQAYEITDKVIISQQGRARQMNNGAAIASGDILLFLHADTLLPDGALDSILSHADTGGFWGRFDVRLSSSRFVYRIIESLINWRSCVSSIATGDQAMFIEKDLFEKVNGFPEVALMEDIGISRRLKRIKRPICLKQRVITSSRRWEKNGVLSTVLLMWKLRLYYFLGVSPDRLSQLYR